MTDIFKIKTDNGKYEFINDNGTVIIYRHDELWDYGNKAVLSLLHKIEEDQNRIKELEDKLNMNNKNNKQENCIVEYYTQPHGIHYEKVTPLNIGAPFASYTGVFSNDETNSEIIKSGLQHIGAYPKSYVAKVFIFNKDGIKVERKDV